MSATDPSVDGGVDRSLDRCESPDVEPIRVLIVDDHEIFRAGLRLLLDVQPDITVVGDVGSAEDAVATALTEQPDVVVMDLNMPVRSGVEATREIVGTSPHIGVLILTQHEDDDSLFEALRAGARGYLLKSDPSKEIIDAVRLGGGPSVFSKGVAQRILDQFQPGRAVPILPELTEREREILRLIAEGENNAAIARALFLSPKTVRNHISNIFQKLSVTDRAQAIVRARRAGLTDDR